MDIKELKRSYQREYELEREPSDLEVLRIRAIELERKYCEESCRTLSDCQFEGADKGFKPKVIADDLNRFNKKHLYFGVIKCERAQEADRQARERRGLEASNLPYPKPLTPPQEEILKKIEANKNYYLIGAHGSGKTNLLSHLGKRYLRAGKRVKYVSEPELMIELRVGSESYRQQLKECKEAEILIIDDWRGGENRYNEEQLWVILNHREIRGRVSIISSREGISKQRGRIREKLESYNTLIMK